MAQGQSSPTARRPRSRAGSARRHIRATLPEVGAERAAGDYGRDRRRAPWRLGDPDLQQLRRRAARAAHPLRSAADIEVIGARLEDAFLELVADSREPRCELEAQPHDLARYTRYELLRTFRERRLFLFAFGFPLILYFVIALPNRHSQDFSGPADLAPALLHGQPGLVRDDDVDAVGRFPDRRRTPGRLDPPAAHHPAVGRAYLAPRS